MLRQSMITARDLKVPATQASLKVDAIRSIKLNHSHPIGFTTKINRRAHGARRERIDKPSLKHEVKQCLLGFRLL